jgi:hypothetical protein
VKTNRWVTFSLRFYSKLLCLYPQAYRIQYEMEMLRAFKNQCREAYQQQGRLGILLLWPRTLVDVGITVVREHLSNPQATVGLLDAMPNAPLPWKGVLLVLIPGLIFFVSQIEQLTSSNDWFFLAFYRAGYFLMVPVLLVWLLTRRFPIWGLIPFGLLYSTLASYNPAYVIRKLGLYTPSDWGLYPTAFSPGYWIAVSACVVLLCGLIWYLARQGQIPRSAWKWMGLYGLLILLQVAGEIYRFFLLGYEGWTPLDVRNYLLQMPFWFLYDALPFLLLVFIGMLFARRYEGFSFLVLLGYLLPMVVFGRYDPTQPIVPFYVVSFTVLIYRFVVALMAPIWLVRAASIPRRQRAAAIPVAIAIVCHISLNVIVSLAWASNYSISLQASLLNLALIIWRQLIIAAGLGLAVILYLPREKDQAVVSPPALAATLE